MERHVRCIVCSSDLAGPASQVGQAFDWRFECPRCGPFEIDLHLMRTRFHGGPRSPVVVAALSHAIRSRQRPRRAVLVTEKLVDDIEREPKLPTVVEQAEALILLLGDRSDGPSEYAVPVAKNDCAAIGALDEGGFVWLVEALKADGLVEQHRTPGEYRLRLTFKGWQEYERLRRGKAEGRRGFMAMEYGNRALADLFRDHFKRAAAQAGFDLVRLDEDPRAGLIDDRMRVEIRRSRFVVADLSDKNAGAYWEAGLAEGLGKPVIYTCDRRVWEDEGTHFDTSHYHTVIWDAAEPEQAAEKLKATIRATLPAEAKLED